MTLNRGLQMMIHRCVYHEKNDDIQTTADNDGVSQDDEIEGAALMCNAMTYLMFVISNYYLMMGD